MYQNNMRIAMFIVFLIVYTFIVNDRTEQPTAAEWALYVVVCGYIFEEFRLVRKRSFLLKSGWTKCVFVNTANPFLRSNCLIIH